MALPDIRPKSGIRIERGAHGLERPVEARFRRPERDPEHDGDFRQRQVEVVMKDDERPRLRLEAAEAAFELVAVRRGRRDVGRGGGIDRGEFDVEAVAPQPARLIDAGANQQPVVCFTGRERTSPGAHARVNAVRSCSTTTSTWRHTNRREVLCSSAPGSMCASHSTWKPLQMPSTGPPSCANRETSPITGAKRAIAPARR